MKHAVRLATAAFALVALPLTGEAASFRGKVTLSDGKPAYGAMVTVFNAEKTTRQTVYTAADGSYAIRTPYAGKLDVRARLANFADQTTTVDSTDDPGAATSITPSP